MGFQTKYLSFVLVKNELIHLLLLKGSVLLTANDGQHFLLSGSHNHDKLGTPGVEDGSSHTFSCFVSIDGRDFKATVISKSQDKGETYVSHLKYDEFPPDNLSE